MRDSSLVIGMSGMNKSTRSDLKDIERSSGKSRKLLNCKIAFGAITYNVVGT